MAQDNPKVSIVLPTYNGGSKYLRQSIDSCLGQTYGNIELVVIDDCSTDATPQLVRSYTDPRLRYIRNATNQRLPRSLNIGFKNATGEFLTWTSDDNFYEPQAIQKMVSYLLAQPADFVYCDIYAVKEGAVSTTERWFLAEPETLKDANCVMACFMYRRKVRDTVGEYDPDSELIEDYDYWVRVSKHFRLHHLKEPLYHYRYHEQSLCGSRYKEIQVLEHLFKLKYGFMSPDDANWSLRQLKAQRDGGAFWQKLLNRLFWKKRIERILKEFLQGNIPLPQARSTLHQIVNGAQQGKADDFNFLIQRIGSNFKHE